MRKSGYFARVFELRPVSRTHESFRRSSRSSCWEIEAQQRLSQVWQPVEAFRAITGVAGALVRDHDQYLCTFPGLSVPSPGTCHHLVSIPGARNGSLPYCGLNVHNVGRLDTINTPQILQSGCCRRPLPYPRAWRAWPLPWAAVP